MEERFETSPKLTGPECLGIAGCAGALVICSVCTVASVDRGSAAEFLSYGRLTLYLAVTGAFWALLRATLSREARQTFFSLSDSHCVLTRPHRTVSIPLNGVEKFKYVRVPFAPAFGLVRSRDATIRITFRTQNLPALISSLQSSLAARGRAAAYSEKNVGRFLAAARRAEQTDARLRSLMPFLAGVSALASAVSAATAIFLWWFPVFLSLLWAVFGLLLFVNAIRAAEFMLSRGTPPAEAAGEAGANFAAPARAYFLCGLAAFTIYLCCGIALTSVFPL